MLSRLSRGDCAGECASTEQVQRCIGACAEVQRCRGAGEVQVGLEFMEICHDGNYVPLLGAHCSFLHRLLPTFHHFTPTSLMDNDGGGEVEDGG